MEKTKIYELWYSDCDDYGTWKFVHDEIKSQEDFKKDCIEVLRENTEAFLEQNDLYVGTRELLELISKNLKSRGYKLFELEFDIIDFGMGGSSILKKQNEYGGNKIIIECLGQDLKQKVYEYNQQISSIK